MPNNKEFSFRALNLTRAKVNEMERTAETVMTTENPAVVVDWSRWELIREVLLMDGVIMPETKQIPLLDTHDSEEIADILGSVRNMRTEGDSLIGTVHFSSVAEDAFIKVKEGHLTDVSVGYKVFSDSTIRIPKGEKAIVNGREFENNFNDNLDLVIRTKWELLELSLVPIGADPSAKFRSRFGAKNKDEPQTITADQIQKLINDSLNNQRTNTMPEPNVNTPDTPVTAPAGNDNGALNERERAATISAISELLKLDPALATKAIQEGTSIIEFREIAKKAKPEPKAVQDGNIGMTPAQVKSYSIIRAIEAAITGNWKNAGLEKEASEAAAALRGKSAKGFLIPHDVLQRGNTVGTVADGGFLVASNNLAGSFIELLRNKALLFSLGVRQLSGLTGNVYMNKQTGSNTAYWVNENGAPTEGKATFGQVSMSPKTLAAVTSISRTLTLQADPSIDALVNDDLAKVLALEIDRVGFAGTGKSNQPLGILNTTGIGSVTGTSFTYATAIDFETKVAAANADAQTMYYVTNPTIYGGLKGRTIATNYPSFLIGPDNRMNGYEVKRTAQVPANTIVFGDFSQLVVGMWSGLDVYVDPTPDDTGAHKIKVFQDMDLAVRQPGAFAASTAWS